MRSVNKVILVGNLTRDPELKNTSSGQSIVTFGLATNRQWVTSNGERKDSAEFHECVAWAKLAEICQKHLKKGMLVYVEGYLKTRSWDLEDGTRRFRTEVVLQDMIMLEKRSDSDEFLPADDEETQDKELEVKEPVEETVETPETPETPAEETPAAPAAEEPAPESPAPGTLSADIEDDNMF